MMEFYKKLENKRIVIMGCGRLGANLADYLYEQGHEVIVVDSDEDAFRKLSASYGGLTFISDATELETFDKLEIDEQTTMIVVTDSDNTNILISQVAREVYHVKTIICRLYDPQRECVYDEFHIDTICPTYLSVHRIEDILKERGA
ncbi:potassium channel family protein [Longibaculum muris]|uniref:Trk system potassium uptake protein TrkA n=1 Tax=Longibaculum muris TaxID=1796628 RepID=A0A4R3Z6H9_9FIRM|nr:TrkA family potassium uptake protein [Longibaculum muris]KXU49930.1 TrkA protein [Candidatus Stoquefichus sp. KLE1796]MBS5368103.1 TrkA family potassium uptake protein [Coprobacillus cateniformis]MCR1887517.1 TrkA family potassium uptake protein [Longibaculum muris]MED9811765.1 TrkA family potassium uptake protein [Longibaculum muris]TCW00766.1 trk system potassium uptake protein TrkA [Longibaculum muris]